MKGGRDDYAIRFVRFLPVVSPAAGWIRLSTGSLLVDLLCEFGKFFVGFLFFRQSLFEQGCVVALAQSLGKGNHGAVSGDFIVFNPLRCPDQCCIEDGAFQALLQ